MVGKARDNRLRRMAKRRNVKIEKSRARDGYCVGLYRIVDPAKDIVLAGSSQRPFELTADEVEEYLKRMTTAPGGTGG